MPRLTRQRLFSAVSSVLMIAALLLLYWAGRSQAAGSAALKPAERQFIEFLLPLVRTVNKDILADRQRILMLHEVAETALPIDEDDKQWLLQLAKRYEAPDEAMPLSATAWQQLIRRVDIIPASLVLAQAINESAWGRSRFAKEGNNYFGQWCYVEGCGLIPHRRPTHASYEVRKFISAEASVASYIHNLNVSAHYKELRMLRYQQRQLQQPLSGLLLAQGLAGYSTEGQRYVLWIRKNIRVFHLERYNRHQLYPQQVVH